MQPNCNPKQQELLTMTGKTHWMVVLDQKNFDVTLARGFDIQGIDHRNRRKASRITSGDKFIFYVKDKRGFAASCTATSDYFEDDTEIWNSHDERELFRHRVKMKPNIVLKPSAFIDAKEVGPTLEYLKAWPAELWELALFGMLHIIPQRDFSFLDAEMQRLSKTSDKSKSLEKIGDNTGNINRKRRSKKRKIVSSKKKTRRNRKRKKK